MRKFTFIADYKGGTYISQYWAEDVIIARDLWAEGLPSKYFKKPERKLILRAIAENRDDDGYLPILINEVDSVWHDLIPVKEEYIDLNIVETVETPHEGKY